jgi:hypothetical protein
MRSRGKVEPLTESELLRILRAADDIVGQGGRTLLSKILKGSRERKLLSLGLDRNPSYGCWRGVPQEEVMIRIDRAIATDYLMIEYSGKLPMVVFTGEGWSLERAQMVQELLREWDEWIEDGVMPPSMEYLKDRNRGMITLFLETIRQTGDPKYIPLLERWELVDYRKVRAMIRDVVNALKVVR